MLTYDLDISKQAHVYLDPALIGPKPAGYPVDDRDIDLIVTEGLRAPYYSIDTINPLSIEVLHEVNRDWNY